MRRIGITGGIGSGKSVVSRLLRIMGYSVYDTDSEAKRLMESSLEVVNVYAPANRQAGVKIKAESPEEAVAQAMKLIADAKVL